MKCIQAEASRSAQASIRINGVARQEYGFWRSGKKVCMCYIPVEDDEDFSVKVTLYGIASKGQADLYVDGALRDSSLFTLLPKSEHNLSFDKAYCKSGRDLVPYSMKFKKQAIGTSSETALDSSNEPLPGCVSGTIYIRLSIADTRNDQYEVRDLPTSLTSEPMGTPTPSGSTYQVVYGQRGTPAKLKEGAEQDIRPGLAPWCEFCFVYYPLEFISRMKLPKTTDQALGVNSSVMYIFANQRQAAGEMSSLVGTRNDEHKAISAKTEHNKHQESRTGSPSSDSDEPILSHRLLTRFKARREASSMDSNPATVTGKPVVNIRQSTRIKDRQQHSSISFKRTAMSDRVIPSKLVKCDIPMRTSPSGGDPQNMAEAGTLAAGARSFASQEISTGGPPLGTRDIEGVDIDPRALKAALEEKCREAAELQKKREEAQSSFQRAQQEREEAEKKLKLKQKAAAEKYEANIKKLELDMRANRDKIMELNAGTAEEKAKARELEQRASRYDA